MLTASIARVGLNTIRIQIGCEYHSDAAWAVAEVWRLVNHPA